MIEEGKGETRRRDSEGDADSCSTTPDELRLDGRRRDMATRIWKAGRKGLPQREVLIMMGPLRGLVMYMSRTSCPNLQVMSRKGSVGYVQEEGIEGTRARAYTRFINESIKGSQER